MEEALAREIVALAASKARRATRAANYDHIESETSLDGVERMRV